MKTKKAKRKRWTPKKVRNFCDHFFLQFRNSSLRAATTKKLRPHVTFFFSCLTTFLMFLELWQGYEENKEQLHPDMITFSGLPKSVCNTLVNLDTIKERNKSKETEDVPKPAPFILSSTLAEPRVRFRRRKKVHSAQCRKFIFFFFTDFFPVLS